MLGEFIGLAVRRFTVTKCDIAKVIKGFNLQP